MKINKDKYPFIEKILSKTPVSATKIPIPTKYMHDQFLANKDEIMRLYATLHGMMHTVRYVSESVIALFNKNETVAQKLWELRGEIDTCNGIFISKNETYYIYSIKKFSQHVEINLMMFRKEILVMALVGRYNVEYDGLFQTDVTKSILPDGYEEHEVSYLLDTAFLIIGFEVFRKYADVEVKMLPASKQIKDTVYKCVYQNESSYPVEIIDSTYYTTLVKSDSFKVTGHFRLQPYGTGLKKRKLIWINDFVKDGYTREAKILSSGESVENA